MKRTDIPTKLPIPFANSAGVSFIRTVPTASQIGSTDGAASLTDGFPPLTFQPVASGGIPPFGEDMNGILNQMSAWTRWQSAGGQVAWDSGFSSLIGGYPLGACIASATTAGAYWVSTTDNNTTNPDASGAGWLSLFNGLALTNGSISQPFSASLFHSINGFASSGSQTVLMNDNYTASVNTANSAYVQHYVLAGSGSNPNSAPNMSQFFLNAGNSGYQMLPSGMMIQWFSVTVPLQSGGTYNFPFTFPNNAMFATGNVGSAISPSANWETVGLQAISRTQYNLTLSANISGGTGTVFIIAFGY